MIKILRYLTILAIACFSFIIIDDVSAMANLNGLADLTLDPFGLFYDNVNGSSRSIGYTMNLIGEDPNDPLAYYVAFPTGSTQYTNGGQGGSIVQCNMSFVAGNYYSVTYYWLSDSMSYYYHPYYSNLTNKLAIGNSPSTPYPNFTYQTVSTDIQRKLVQNIGYVSAYTVIFKAPNTGTCLLSTFSSNPTGPSDGLGFVGYTYRSLGSSAPTAVEIAFELKAQFSSLENSLNAGFGSVIGSITSGNNELGDKVDNSTDTIINNQEQNKQEIIDNENANHQEAEETRKGIWASLTEGISNIGKWFGDLTSSIGNFFKDLGSSIANGFTSLFDSIKSLFVGEEVCETVPPKIYNLIKYEGVEPDDQGWYTYTCTSSTCPQFTVPYIDTIENAKYYNSFFEIKDLESVGNYRIHPYFSYSGQYGDSGISPYLVQNGSLSFSDASIISKDNVLFNKRTIYAYLNSSSYFTKLSVTNLKGSSLSFKFRILVTDDMSMTVDNYEYPLPKNECTTNGGLFGMLSNFFKSIGEFFGRLFGFIEDDSVDSESAGGFFNNFESEDNGGISSVITAPLGAVRKMTNKCYPLTLKVMDSDVDLPCGTTLFWDKPEVHSFRMTWNLIVGGSFIFLLLSKVFKLIENIKDPTSDKVEVMKL